MSSFVASDRKSFFALLLLAVVVVAWVLGCNLKKSPSSKSDSSQTADTTKGISTLANVVFPVDVALAKRGDLIKGLVASGTIRAKREVEIVARVNGEIDSVSVLDGKFVKLGDLLVKVDDKEYRLAYDKAASLLLAAQIEYRSLSTSVFIPNQDTTVLCQHH